MLHPSLGLPIRARGFGFTAASARLSVYVEKARFGAQSLVVLTLAAPNMARLTLGTK